MRVSPSNFEYKYEGLTVFVGDDVKTLVQKVEAAKTISQIIAIADELGNQGYAEEAVLFLEIYRLTHKEYEKSLCQELLEFSTTCFGLLRSKELSFQEAIMHLQLYMQKISSLEDPYRTAAVSVCWPLLRDFSCRFYDKLQKLECSQKEAYFAVYAFLGAQSNEYMSFSERGEGYNEKLRSKIANWMRWRIPDVLQSLELEGFSFELDVISSYQRYLLSEVFPEKLAIHKKSLIEIPECAFQSRYVIAVLCHKMIHDLHGANLECFTEDLSYFSQLALEFDPDFFNHR